MKKYIGETFDLTEFYERLYGYVAPPFPKLGDLESQLLPSSSKLRNILTREEENKKTPIGTDILMSLSLGTSKETLWEIPTEPIISIKGGHKIIRRFPNRSTQGGSIKERWSSDDYKITIKGALIEFSEEKYPEDQVKTLRKICQHQGSVIVNNALFRIFGIERIVIENYNIPFTQGLPVQSYTIQGYSDTLFDALLTEK